MMLSAFAERLTAPEPEVPTGIVAPDGSVSARRFAVYRNNAASTLIEALGDNFPLCRALVGERFFDAMAELHMREHPPRSPILAHYGDTFANFVSSFPPAAGVPYLADVARLEWAWLEAYHAVDATPLAADTLSAFDPDSLGDVRFTLHPALVALRSSFAIVSIASRVRADGDLAGLDMEADEDALLTRPLYDVELRALPSGAFEFIETLRIAPLGPAAEAGAAIDGFDLTANIAGLFSAGGVIHLELER